jgi:hypothetical protein
VSCDDRWDRDKEHEKRLLYVFHTDFAFTLLFCAEADWSGSELMIHEIWVEKN